VRTALHCYLPDGARTAVPETEAFEAWLDPSRTAVACIDMHRSHVGTDAEAPLPAPRATDRVAAHDRFHAACRDLGVPVIMVQHWQRHGGVDDLRSPALPGGANWRVLAELFLPHNPLMDELGWEGTRWVDLMVETDPERDFYIRTKKRLSGFYPTDLEFLLRQLEIRNLVITGTLTDACVLSTAFDAANRDLRVIVPRDVVAGLSAEHEAAALMIIATHLGLVVDAPAVLREWYARRERKPPAELAGADRIDEAIGAPGPAA
jgi:nicotinamidase-related amidase